MHPHTWPSGRTLPRASVRIGRYLTPLPDWAHKPLEGSFLLLKTLHFYSLSLPFANDTPALALCRLLIAGTDSSDLQQILSILESTNDLLLTSSYLSNSSFTGEHTESLVTRYLNATGNRWCSWSVSTVLMGVGEGGRWWLWGRGPHRHVFLQVSQAGLLTASIPAQLLRLYQLLFFTLPGTPIFSYGDEIGLKAAVIPGQVPLIFFPA